MRAIVGPHKGPVYGKRCGDCGQYWPCDTERSARMANAINELFDTGGPDEDQLPAATWHKTENWQAPGTVSVRIKALQRLAEAAGITDD